MKFSLSVKDIHGSHDKLQHFHDRYALCFLTKTRNMTKQSFQYIQGKLLGKGRGNMCSYAKDVPDCNNQFLQLADIPCNLRVWLHKPKIGLPERKKGRGRPPRENK